MNHIEHLNFMSQLGYALGSGRFEEANAMATGKKHITSKVITPPADSGITADGDGHEGRSGHEQEAAGLDEREIGGAIGADGNVYSDADPGL